MAAALGMVIWIIIGFFLLGAVDPFAVAVGVIYAVVFILLRGGGRAGPIALVVTSGLLFLMMALLGSEDLAHPESWRGFVGSLGILLLAGVGVLAGVGLLREWDVDWADRIGVSAAAILVTGVVLGLGAASSLEDDVAETGDLAVTAVDVRFQPTALAAPHGPIDIFIENRDPIRHTFTVRALGIDIELPALTDRRVSFEAPPGAYTVICDVPGHERMSMTLFVED